MIVWLNGRLCPADEARIDPRDRGLLLGDGVFETLLARAGRMFRFADHMARLRRGADVLGLPPPPDGIESAVRATLVANRLDEGNAAVRITLTRGPGTRGLLPPAAPNTTLLVTAVKAASAPGPAAAVITAQRRNEHSPTCRIKSLNYLDNVLARREAAKRGADEALMLNAAGALACASAANLFLVENGALVTPSLAQGALPGVTRAAVIELAAADAIPVHEEAVTPERLFAAAEAFVTNSLIGLRPLVTADGRPIGNGAPGPLTRTLQRAFTEALDASA